MKRNFALIIFTLICYVTLSGQQSLQLRGTVRDEQTGLPLPNTHIVIKNKQIVAITDKNGKFRLALNEVHLDDSIIVSYVGFSPIGLSISNYLSLRDSLINLKHSTILLREVVISSKQPDLMPFMKNAVKAYNKDKRKSPYIAKGYYREKAKYDNQYVMFAESIGYSVYNGMKEPHTGFSFFCENTRKSDNMENWKKYSRKALNGEKLSDVTSSSTVALKLFQEIENYGPISEKYWESFTFQLDSTSYNNNEKIYNISFKKGSDFGNLQVLAESYQIKNIRYFSKSIYSIALSKDVNCQGNIELIYINNLPFINHINFHYITDNLEYWNEYNLLMQKFDHFNFNDKDYYSMIFYEMVPYLEYLPQKWAINQIPMDSDYETICRQLKSTSKTLEEQFQANSGKWWLNDFQKWLPDMAPNLLEDQVKRARDLIARLKKLF